jgi:primase-polymerase (primpol)-like protein
LTSWDQWLVWRFVWKGGNDGTPGRWAKVPFNAHTGRAASVTNASTWSSFARARQAYEKGGYDGIGFVLSENDPFVGIDLDHCRDPKTGALESWAQEVLALVPSYVELSPSGEGLHLFLRGALPHGAGNRKGLVEVYDRRRYLTVTGRPMSVPTALTAAARPEEVAA